MTSPDDTLDRILQLALQARLALLSSDWKRCTDEAIQAHAEACENLWNELYRLLDERENEGNPVHKPKMPIDPKKKLKNQIILRIKSELPSMIGNIIDEF